MADKKWFETLSIPQGQRCRLSGQAAQTSFIMGVAMFFGILFWVLDSYFEYTFFHENLSFLLLEGPESLMDSMLFKVPLHSLFVRGSFLVAALLGGMMTAVFLHSKTKSDTALRVSEGRYRNIFETARDAIVVCTSEAGGLVDVNRFACELYGYNREEMLAMNFRDLVADPDKHIVTSKGIENWIPLQYHRKKSNEVFPAEVSVSTNTWHQLDVCTVVIRDISERTRAENEKQLLEAQLHRAQKMEALGTLAGGVAHDLNNILSALVGYPDLLLMDLPEESPLRKPIMTIKKSGQKAAEIVQDLLTLARRGVTITQVVNLNTVVNEYFQSLEFSRLKSLYPEISFEVSLDAGLFNILGSSVHLSKAIMNLVANAMEAIAGCGKITISTTNTYVDMPFRGYEDVREGDYVRFHITDTGSGISAVDLPRIFEPFYTKKVMGKSGTGLGMAVIWGTVKDHNGYIDLRSIAGKGTAVDLYFPICREKPGEQKEVLTSTVSGGAETILVVDDIEEQREIISHMLTHLGYRVTCVAGGKEALAYLQEHSADLLILDMIMDPGIDGLTTYQLVKQHKPKQKAIISSGFSETSRVREALQLGAGVYLKKPYVMEDLAKAVRMELDKEPVL
ncbi:MAG: response regulator [Desulforhopalus sp.]|nr:response regulator [Desulforhopalus sp.]